MSRTIVPVFPKDLMFQLKADEIGILRFQSGISSWGGRQTRLDVFTEQSVAMLSRVLRSDRAVQVNTAPANKPRRESGFHVREASPRYGTPKRQ